MDLLVGGGTQSGNVKGVGRGTTRLLWTNEQPTLDLLLADCQFSCSLVLEN
jgi:hypothetical protein